MTFQLRSTKLLTLILLVSLTQGSQLGKLSTNQYPSKVRYDSQISIDRLLSEPCSANCSSGEQNSITDSSSQNGNSSQQNTVTTDTQPVNDINNDPFNSNGLNKTDSQLNSTKQIVAETDSTLINTSDTTKQTQQSETTNNTPQKQTQNSTNSEEVSNQTNNQQNNSANNVNLTDQSQSINSTVNSTHSSDSTSENQTNTGNMTTSNQINSTNSSTTSNLAETERSTTRDQTETDNRTSSNQTQTGNNTSSNQSETVNSTTSNQTQTGNSSTSSNQTETVNSTSSNQTETVNSTSSNQSETVNSTSSNQTETGKNTSSNQSETVNSTSSNQSDTVNSTSSNQSETVNSTSSNQTETGNNTSSNQFENVNSTLSNQSETVNSTTSNQTETGNSTTTNKTDQSNSTTGNFTNSSISTSYNKTEAGNSTEVQNPLTQYVVQVSPTEISVQKKSGLSQATLIIVIVVPLAITLVVTLAIIACIIICKKRNKNAKNYEELECLNKKSKVGVEPITERYEDSSQKLDPTVLSVKSGNAVFTTPFANKEELEKFQAAMEKVSQPYTTAGAIVSSIREQSDSARAHNQSERHAEFIDSERKLLDDTNQKLFFEQREEVIDQYRFHPNNLHEAVFTEAPCTERDEVGPLSSRQSQQYAEEGPKEMFQQRLDQDKNQPVPLLELCQVDDVEPSLSLTVRVRHLDELKEESYNWSQTTQPANEPQTILLSLPPNTDYILPNNPAPEIKLQIPIVDQEQNTDFQAQDFQPQLAPETQSLKVPKDDLLKRGYGGGVLPQPDFDDYIMLPRINSFAKTLTIGEKKKRAKTKDNYPFLKKKMSRELLLTFDDNVFEMHRGNTMGFKTKLPGKKKRF